MQIEDLARACYETVRTLHASAWADQAMTPWASLSQSGRQLYVDLVGREVLKPGSLTPADDSQRARIKNDVVLALIGELKTLLGERAPAPQPDPQSAPAAAAADQQFRDWVSATGAQVTIAFPPGRLPVLP